MIANDHLHDEMKIIEEVIKNEQDAYKKASLKAQVLTIKLLHNLRTNTVLVLKHLGIDTVRPKGKTSEPAQKS